jgi:hypothetical protein
MRYPRTIIMCSILIIGIIAVYLLGYQGDYSAKLWFDKSFESSSSRKSVGSDSGQGSGVRLTGNEVKTNSATNFATGDPRLSGQNLGPSIGRSSVKELLSSNNATLVEYAFTRLRRICGGYETDPPVDNFKKLVLARVADIYTPADKLPRRGTKTERLLALDAFHKQCREITGGVGMSRVEIEAAIRSIEASGFPMRDWMKERYKLGRREAMINDATAELGQKLLQRNLIGEIGILMTDVNSYELSQIAGDDQVGNLQTIASDYIFMCRMGEDCSPGSLASNRFCAENGYCGGHVEETLMNHFHKAGLDWSLFDKYVNRLQRAVLTGDVTIFRTPIPLPTPIKP